MIATAAAASTLWACAPTVLPAGPPQGAPRLEADRFVAADGTALPLRFWTPAAGLPRAIVLALHGFGDHRDGWEEPADLWAAQGIATLAYDQRGFGASPTRGRWAGTASLVDDVGTVLTLLRQRHPGVPIHLAGESMGGALALAAVEAGARPDGLILLATALRSRDTLGPLASGALDLFVHLVPWFPTGPSSIDWRPTDNPRAIEKLRSDPMILRQVRLDMIHGLVEAMDAGKRAAGTVDLPYLMLHGLGDRIVPEAPVRDALRLLPRRPDSRLAVYREGYHLLLRDKAGASVAADIAAWIAAPLSPLPSGADAALTRPDLEREWGRDRAGPR